MNRAFVVIAVAVLAGNVGAQVIQPRLFVRPAVYTSMTVGWFRHDALCSDAEDACWRFGSSLQYRGAIEMPISRTTSLGVAATTARAPLRWGSVNGTGCTACNADVTINQYLAVMRTWGGSGRLQQMFDISAGVTSFSEFSADSLGPIGTGRTHSNFTMGLGVGIGYDVFSRLQIFLVQEYAYLFHKPTGGSPNRTKTQQTLRAGGRIAFGGR